MCGLMDAVRKRILVTGKVQGVGYRALVKHFARLLAIKGYVRNLDDGSVEIYAQAPNKVMEEFIAGIKVKGEEGNIFSPSVGNVVVFPDSDKSFKPRQNAFKAFWVHYDENLSAGEKEMIEKAEIGALMLTGVDSRLGGIDSRLGGIDSKLSDLRDDTKSFRQETNENFVGLKSGVSAFRQESAENFQMLNDEAKAFRRETNENFSGLKNETREFRQENNENLVALKEHTTDFKGETRGSFEKLDVKYDSVSGTLNKINANLEKLNKTIEHAVQKFVQ